MVNCEQLLAVHSCTQPGEMDLDSTDPRVLLLPLPQGVGLPGETQAIPEPLGLS